LEEEAEKQGDRNSEAKQTEANQEEKQRLGSLHGEEEEPCLTLGKQPSQPSSPVTRQLHQRCQTPPPSCLSSSSSSHPALHHLKKRQHLLLCTGKKE